MFCVSIGEKKWANLRTEVDKYSKEANLLEIRLDYLEEDLSEEKLKDLISLGKPLIITHRIKEEGGFSTLSPEERLSFLAKALTLGAYLVDLEWRVLKEYWQGFGKPPFSLSHTLVSVHFFSRPKVPSLGEYLLALLKEMRNYGVEWAKVVCYSEEVEDGLELLRLIPEGKRLGLKVVAFGMGEKLAWTRLVSLFLGAPFTYVSRDSGKETAPGQLNLSLAKKIYEGLAGCTRSME